MAARKKQEASALQSLLTVPTSSKSSKLDTIPAPKDLVTDIDEFVRLKDEISALEGKLDVVEHNVKAKAETIYAERAIKGEIENFKLATDHSVTTFIVQNRGSAIKKADRDAFAKKYGEKAASELLQTDIKSFRLNEVAMEQYGEEIAKALLALGQKLGVSILDQDSGSFKVTENVVKKATKYAKSAKELAALIEDLKLTRYPKA